MDAAHFPTVAKMLQTVKTSTKDDSKNSFINELKNFLKRNKYFPMLQIKPVFKSESLILLHNTYKRNDVSHFADLYEEARSVIIDVSKPLGDNIIVSLADKIPENKTLAEYVPDETDVITKAYAGTMIYVYNHDDTWFFGTSTIPDMDYSRYFHPTKTHGDMFDEAIKNYFDEPSRERFVKCLSPDKTYGFLLVHHQNGNLMDYTAEFGENYAVLFHVFSRNKENKGMSADYTDRLVDISMKYPEVVTIDAVKDLNTYGVIVRKADGTTFKVCREEIFKRENKNRGNSNHWYNMTDVYMKGHSDYHIDDYINDHFGGDKSSLTMTDELGRIYEPTYIIHEVMRNMCATLYGMYRTTTYYNRHTGRYKVSKDIENDLPPIIRFHLTQLRSIQITTHAHAPITPLTVRHYICLHQTMKNIRLLVSHFAKTYSSQEHSKNYKTTQCFVFLDKLLK
jgi:hypothetical protein